jgi:hypothetical protein
VTPRSFRRRKFLDDNNLVKRLGSVAWRAEDRLCEWIAGSNLVVADCVRRELRADCENLLKQDGVEPSSAERLIARRAAHNAAVVHGLEALMMGESPGSPAAAAIAKDLNRAERRLLPTATFLVVLGSGSLSGCDRRVIGSAWFRLRLRGRS